MLGKKDRNMANEKVKNSNADEIMDLTLSQVNKNLVLALI
jgi:hypothetical protein